MCDTDSVHMTSQVVNKYTKFKYKHISQYNISI